MCPPAGILRELFYKIFKKEKTAGILREPFYKNQKSILTSVKYVKKYAEFKTDVRFG